MQQLLSTVGTRSASQLQALSEPSLNFKVALHSRRDRQQFSTQVKAQLHLHQSSVAICHVPEKTKTLLSAKEPLKRATDPQEQPSKPRSMKQRDYQVRDPNTAGPRMMLRCLLA